MNTTAVFIELLIAGVQASIWVMVLIVAFGGDSGLASLMPSLEKWATLATFMVFTFWYTLGIIIDRLASLLFAMIYTFAASQFKSATVFTSVEAVLAHDPDKTDDRRLKILISEKGLSAYLEFTRSRIRIIRDSTLNVLLIVVALVFFAARRGDLLGTISAVNLAISAIVLGVIIVVILLAVAFMLKDVDDARLKTAENELNKARTP